MSRTIDKLQAEAAEWLARLDAGTADAAAFEAWRARDPRHALAYAQAIDAWERLSARTTGTISQAEPEPVPAAQPVARRHLLRAAAVALPLAMAGGLFWQMGSGRAQAATGPAEQRRFEIAPGLSVMLNAESAVAWDLGSERCDLWIERGEAAIRIEPMLGRRVVAHCDAQSVALAPGDYNVRAGGEGGSELLVLRGRAKPDAAGAATPARDGDRLTFAAGRAAIAPAPVAMTRNAVAWTKGEIVFDGQTLREALDTYNRNLDRKLVLADPALGSLRIGGRFDLFRAEAFLASIEASFDLESERQGDRILLRKKDR